VLDRDPNHAKVLQQLGWLHHQQSTNYTSQEQAIEYLEKSVASGEFCTSVVDHAHVTNLTKTKPMHKVGTSWAGATCHNKNTPKPMKLISKPCIVTAATLRSGAVLVCCTTRSTSTAMLLTRTPELFA
jgi:hypothetical protein